MAWLRVLYTLLGAVISFAGGLSHLAGAAREGLRRQDGDILEGAGSSTPPSPRLRCKV